MVVLEEEDTQLIGFLLAIASLIMTAIFPIFGKLDRVKQCNINPLIFNIYFMIGTVLFCLIVTVIVSIIGPLALSFSYMGLISGIILGIGSWFIWLSLTYMGIAHTSAIASGIASITGFIEGVLIGNYPDHLGLSLFSLFLICIGVIGIGFNESLTSFIVKKLLCQSNEIQYSENGINNIAYNEPQILFRFSSNPYVAPTRNRSDSNETENTPLNHSATASEEDYEEITMAETAAKPMKIRLIGILFSFLGGICFGSLSFPEMFATADTTEVYYLPSFGVGVFLMIIVDCTVLSFKLKEEQLWHFEACFIPGLAAGVIWAIGFLCILYAELLIDYEMAIPIRECSICVAVLIGIFGFNEIIDKRAIVVVLICVCVVLIGCFLLPVGVE